MDVSWIRSDPARGLFRRAVRVCLRDLTLRSSQVESGNWKLIRSSLNEVKEFGGNRRAVAHRNVFFDQTNAENFYYMKQMQSKTPMVIVLKDGETLEGTIEWYDKCCLKVNREGAPNLLVFKPNIKYMYKAG